MANIVFAWMVDRIRESTELAFAEKTLAKVIKDYSSGLESLLNREGVKDPTVYRGWGVGPVLDSYADQSAAVKTISGSSPRTPGRSPPEIDPEKKAPAPGGPPPNTQEYIHPV